MRSLVKILLVVLLTAAVLLGAYFAYLRVMVENQNKTVEIAVDYAELDRAGIPLSELRNLGIPSIAVLEETPLAGTLNGDFYFSSGNGILSAAKMVPPEIEKYRSKKMILKDRCYILAENPVVRKRIANNLLAAVTNKELKFLGGNVIEINRRESEVKNLGIGFSEKTIKKLSQFHVIPRLMNRPGDNIEKKIKLLAGFDTIIFEGEEVVGFPGRIKETAQSLTKSNLTYGYIEIINQLGSDQLKKLVGKKIVKVHSIGQDEMRKVNQEKAVERFTRAVKERNVRLLYVRPYLTGDNLTYLSTLKTNIEKAGFMIGRASSPQDIILQNWQLMVLGLGVVAATIILLDTFFKLNAVLMLLLLLLGTFIANPQILALLAAVVFPSLSMINAFKRSAPKPVMTVLNVVSETTMGIMILIGLLSGFNFMVGIDTFMGVKLALVIPIAIVGFYFIVRGEDNWVSYQKIKERILFYLNSSVPFSFIILAIVLFGAAYLLLARSGNFILPVSGIETAARGWLENILVVRPRFKEFAIGYPALFIAAALFNSNRKSWLWLLLPIATIAPTSLLNSFSHIHTPLVVSLIRSLNGLWIGVGIGFIISLFIKKQA
ncbi:hypothetical protein A2276_05035 [candidate division WOR-1 bacterium RIFOXYA12_FULL_43_27]|uniref:Uncharacterized protein n=1 Tax=candidate division WOR-1 bacterium RIFOXYC2_FULL_46_14 TaxID=1802587 RepID=A0A1F4U857_UNCSA|nr:MAG: hypothetical protein A2276_05035 [candidate division WOR-1 bacterium RIFOXYA12_FULL_43_27]OGC20031.1 MAG: hypothetical protein A2292_03040 [candidate division WOR-1 bacterium RIFOXYB2_FULL_46_45]OGC32232.1 MAG: hypothetical protein A2232_08405 [candidate division WOR-1 bacterium RIFOXYA2_FULL_46_56]OGC41136.1 MAG: hypothetical protein A2438_07345 [candidate division WOR-1 bacterium RIFOXYC2_FULL_46_14]